MAYITLDTRNISDFVSADEISEMLSEVVTSFKILKEGTGEGNDYLGWLELPSSITNEEFGRIENIASRLQKKSEILVVIGIGGSYLGAKAVNDALSHSFPTLTEKREFPLMDHYRLFHPTKR